jgi:hypothetical protein
MKIIKQLLHFLQRLQKGIMWLVLAILVGGVCFALWDFYLTAPRFLFALDEQLNANLGLMKTIGEKTGTLYTYSKHALAEGDTATFTCTITGRCDSAYVKVSGYYYKSNTRIIGVATDTLVKAACP